MNLISLGSRGRKYPRYFWFADNPARTASVSCHPFPISCGVTEEREQEISLLSQSWLMFLGVHCGPMGRAPDRPKRSCS
jgi:hypothetical protein